MIIEQKILDLDIPVPEIGLTYPSSVVHASIEAFSEGVMVGEIWPAKPKVNPKNISHVVLEIKIKRVDKKEELWATVQVIDSPMGKFVKDAIESENKHPKLRLRGECQVNSWAKSIDAIALRAVDIELTELNAQSEQSPVQNSASTK